MPFLDDSLPALEDLHCFVLATQARSLTAAAATHGVAQSAFSRQLCRLEEQLGGRLLHRTGRGVIPTELGLKVLPRAEALIADAQSLADDVIGTWGQPSGVVRVGLLPSLARPVAARLFNQVREHLPAVHLRLLEAYSGEVQSMLADGQIDVGTVNRYRPTSRDRRDGVLTTPVCVIVSAQSPLVRSGPVRLSDLAELDMVMPISPNSLRSFLEEVMARRRFRLRIALEVNSASAMKDAVMSCGLAAVLPAHSFQEEILQGLVSATPLSGPAIWQTTFIETTKRKPLSAAARLVEKMLVAEVARLRSGA